MDTGGEGTQRRLLVLEVFAGILPGAVACKELGIAADHVYVESDAHAIAVIEEQWPEAEKLAGKSDVSQITEADVVQMVATYRPTYIFLMGGPPCQDVSKANLGGAGAMGPRSSLRQRFKDIYIYV